MLFFLQAEDGIRDLVRSRGLGDVYKRQALQRLYVKIQEAVKEKNYLEQKDKRKSLVGTGDRSDKIRTYNYPQNRVTDHRINLTLYNLDSIVEGDPVSYTHLTLPTSDLV